MCCMALSCVEHLLLVTKWRGMYVIVNESRHIYESRHVWMCYLALPVVEYLLPFSFDIRDEYEWVVLHVCERDASHIWVMSRMNAAYSSDMPKLPLPIPWLMWQVVKEYVAGMYVNESVKNLCKQFESHTWVMSRMDALYGVVVSHTWVVSRTCIWVISQTWVMSHVVWYESCHIWMHYMALSWHIHESCHIHIYESCHIHESCHMSSHIYASFNICMVSLCASHVTYLSYRACWVTSRTLCHTFECVMSHEGIRRHVTYTSHVTYMSHVTYWVMSLV